MYSELKHTLASGGLKGPADLKMKIINPSFLSEKWVWLGVVSIFVTVKKKTYGILLTLHKLGNMAF